MIAIKREFQELLRSQTKEEQGELESSLLLDGCRDPIVLWGNIIVDGHHRYTICTKYGIPFNTVQKDFPGELEAKLWIIRNQRSRRNLSTLDLAELALLEKDLYAEAAERRMLSGKPIKSDPSLPGGRQPDEPGRTSKKLEEVYGISHATIERVDKIKQVAPERLEEIRSGDKSIKAVYSELMRRQNRELREKEYKDNPLPKGEFDVIYADPPWKYDFAETENRAIENHYPTMTIEELCSIDLPVAENAVIFLWATAPKLPEALTVLSAWGFQYKTNAVWDKKEMGMGYWFRGQHELLLVGTKGKFSPPTVENRPNSVFSVYRGVHSKKPRCVYVMIENMFAGHCYLELFARERYSDKWTIWGNSISM